MVNRRLSQPAPGWVGPGGRIYAVGDVHGCATRLAALHRLVAADLGADPVARPLLVHLGDYVDRGPDSAGVVRMLVPGPVLTGLPTVNLRGNHEQMMLDALTGGPTDVFHWLHNGGEATLRSWGIAAHRPAATWRHALAPAEWAFLAGLPLRQIVDGYLLVHAGLRPGAALVQQSAEDMLWIREDFLDWDGPVLPGLAVVHGHTPGPDPVVTAWRIGVDTGAVAGGALTCAVLEGRTVRFLAT